MADARDAGKRSYPNVLIVEGNDDLHSVVGLMRHHVTWPNVPHQWPVFVKLGKSASEIVQPGYLSAEVKEGHVQALGVMLDADDHCQGRYESVRNRIGSLFPDLPATMPATGLVVENDGKRFGLWIMPDNESGGYLENFLRHLVPSPQDPLWVHACQAVSTASRLGAAFREVHTSKANFYTWLAWQDEPDQTPGIALTRKILDPHSKASEPFVRWFRDLYML